MQKWQLDRINKYFMVTSFPSSPTAYERGYRDGWEAREASFQLSDYGMGYYDGESDRETVIRENESAFLAQLSEEITMDIALALSLKVMKSLEY